DDALHFFGRQGLIVAEFAESFDRTPGGHAAAKNLFLDGDGPGARIGVGHQREGCAARMVTGGAMIVDDARDVAGKSNGSGDDVVPLRLSLYEAAGRE